MTEVASADELRSVSMVQDIALPVGGGQVQIGVNERGQVTLAIVTTPDNGEDSSILTASINTRVAEYIVAALQGSIERAEAFAERPAVTN